MLPLSFQAHEQLTRRTIDRGPYAMVRQHTDRFYALAAAAPAAAGRSVQMQERYNALVLQHPAVAR